MITRTPFSSISYNTDDFLICKLNELIDNRTLQFWCFINHKPEGVTEEGEEKKAHKHVLMVPNGQIDTFSLVKYFEEPDLTCDKPLDMKAYKHSQFADWYLYALHDKDYLYSKGKVRKYHYVRDNFFCSDDDYLNELIFTSDFTKWKKVADFRDGVKRGISFGTFLQNGFIPIQQIFQYEKAYKIMKDGYHDEYDDKQFLSFMKIKKDGSVIDTRSGEVVSTINMNYNMSEMPFDYLDSDAIDGGE